MTIHIGVPDKDSLVDRQFVEIDGPDGVTKSFQYDMETNTLVQKDSQVIIPSYHGLLHVTEDPVPAATPWLQGLMSAEDKAKLDSLLQTRLGILGFMGAGFPDDGGWMIGDIILAAGSEFISIERVGNIVRFTAESPIPLSCCEECAQIYWIQDESDTRAIRPPSCNGIMPDVNMYGGIKIFAYPENSVFNPNDPNAFFSRKNLMPALIFKRYENGNIYNLAEHHVILKRNQDSTTNVGWSMTPGPSTVPECVWFMGSDKDGRQIKFELKSESEPGLLGALLYNGHTITKQMAIITGYTNNVLSSNQYYIKKWSIQDKQTVGQEFVATNIWNYTNFTSDNPILTLDKTIQLIDIGELIDVWQFEISNVNNVKQYASYFNHRPRVNEDHLWALSGQVQFGDLHEQRDDTNHTTSGTAIGTGTELTAIVSDVSDIRLFEHTIWGLTGFPNNLYLPHDGLYGTNGYEPSGVIINSRYQAVIDHSLPGLVIKEIPKDTRGDINHDGVIDDDDLTLLMASMDTQLGNSSYNEDADFNKDDKVDVRDLAIFGTNYNIAAKKFSDYPIFLWHRHNHDNALIKFKIGRPESSDFPPFDLLLGAPIDSTEDIFIQILSRGVFENSPYTSQPYVRIAHKDGLPPTGTLRILTGVYRDIVWKYHTVINDENELILIGNEDLFPFDEDYITGSTGLINIPTNTVMCQVVHSDYTTPAIRFEFSVNETTGQESVQLQIRGGVLSMNIPYELDKAALDNESFPYDDYVRGFLPGEFAISDVMTQVGFINDGVGSDIESTPEAFKVYDGGFLPAPIGDLNEKWNEVTVMVRDNQVWLWFNDMLISPSQVESSKLPTPVCINTSYWPMNVGFGKIGLRLWPGAKVRDVQISDQLEHFNEYLNGQLTIS